MIVDVAALPGVPVVFEMFDTTVVDAADMIGSLRMRIRACDATIAGLDGQPTSFDAELKREWQDGVERFQRELAGIKRKTVARN